MKTKYYILLLLTMLSLTACMDKYTETSTVNSPIYMSYETLRSAVKSTSPQTLANPGKIYFKDNYLFVVEKLRGIHILDLTTPTNPKNVGFIEVPGCIDLAIKNNILFADSYVDLVAIDVSDISKIKEVNRVKNALAYTVPQINDKYRVKEVDKEKGVVIGWELVTEKRELEYNETPIYPMWDAYYTSNSYSELNAAAGGISGSGFGKGGSMARFGLYDKYLYVVDNSQLTMFDVGTPGSPVNIGKQTVGWSIETMFIYDDHLFFGTTNGMLVYSLNVPTVPAYVTMFSHATSCDPVVIQNGYAYITLRGGQTCHGDINRLDVVKLSSDYKTNQLVGSFNMTKPYGVGIEGNTLFVCDGDAGLKIYNAADKTKITDNLIAAFPGIKTFDVIPVNGYLFMIGEGGFYLYDYSNLNDIKQISKIPVTPFYAD